MVSVSFALLFIGTCFLSVGSACNLGTIIAVLFPDKSRGSGPNSPLHGRNSMPFRVCCTLDFSSRVKHMDMTMIVHCTMPLSMGIAFANFYVHVHVHVHVTYSRR